MVPAADAALNSGFEVANASLSAMGRELAAYRGLFYPLALLTIVVEIGAPIALLRGRIFGR